MQHLGLGLPKLEAVAEGHGGGKEGEDDEQADDDWAGEDEVDDRADRGSDDGAGEDDTDEAVVT